MNMIKKVFLLSIGFILVGSIANAMDFGDITDKAELQFHGYISQGYMKSSSNNFYAETEEGTSEFSEAAFNIGTDLGDNLHIGMQFLSRKLGEFGKGDVEIDWAYADYRWKDWLGIRAGKMKVIHGLYNTTRDADFLRTSIFLPQSIYNEAWRDSVVAVQGGEVYGDVYLGKAGSIAYQLQGGNGEFPTDSGVATTTTDQAKLIGIDFDAKEYFPKYMATSGLVWTTPVDGLRLSLTGWIVSFSLEGDAKPLRSSALAPAFDAAKISSAEIDVETRSAEWTGSIEYSIGNFLFIAEYSRNNYDFWISGEITEKMAASNIPTLQAVAKSASYKELETEGYYGSVSYRFTDWFEAGFYYSEYFADYDDKDGDANKTNPLRKAAGYKDHDAWLKDACLSLRFDITDNWVFKIEGHKMNGAAILMKDINSGSDGRLDTAEDWYLGAMKITFSF